LGKRRRCFYGDCSLTSTSFNRPNRWSLCLLLSLAGVAVPVGVGGPASAIGGDNYRSLRALGSGDLEIPVARSTAKMAVEFNLPPQARQGPDVWYLVRLHASLEVSSESGRGLVYVSTLVNGRASNQIEVEVGPNADCGMSLKWSAVDLLEGHTADVICGSRLDLRSTNFAQYRAIRPGASTLTFQMEQLDHVKVESLRIFSDSGILISTRGPARLRFKAVTLDDVVNRGERVAVPFVLRNVGDRPARNVAVGFESVPGLKNLGDTVRRYDTIAPAIAVRSAFPIKARRAGRHRLTIAATSTANRPAIELELPVLPDDTERRSGVSRLILIGGLVLFGLGVAILAIERRRSKAGHHT
jgi:hypothetical protein